RLRDKGKLHDYEEAHLKLIGQWFDEHLGKPNRLTASKPPFYRKPKRAISWFKDSAHEHLSRIRDIIAILHNHQVAVRMLKTDRVGYVVYEDEYQIVAEPFTTDSY